MINGELLELFQDRSTCVRGIEEAIEEANRVACYPVVKRLIAVLQARGVKLSQIIEAIVDEVENQGTGITCWDRCIDNLNEAASHAALIEDKHTIDFK